MKLATEYNRPPWVDQKLIKRASMRYILPITYCLAAAGLLGLITLPALAQEAGTDANESHQAGIAANTESPLPKTITVLVDQGFTFHGIFEAPDDLQGASKMPWNVNP